LCYNQTEVGFEVELLGNQFSTLNKNFKVNIAVCNRGKGEQSCKSEEEISSFLAKIQVNLFLIKKVPDFSIPDSSDILKTVISY
jgi:hypothetical protein